MAYDDKKIFIGCPAYDGKIDAECVISIIENIKTLEHSGYSTTLHLMTSHTLVDDARNRITKTFLESSCGWMIFVDNDLAFDGDAFLKLVKSEKQIVAGVYPLKYKEGFTAHPYQREDGSVWRDARDGLIKCYGVPTGCMKIGRKALRELSEAHPEWINEDGMTTYFQTGMLFRSEGDKKCYGEDFAFCKYCDKIGISIWCDASINFKHFGRLAKAGNYEQWLIDNEEK